MEHTGEITEILEQLRAGNAEAFDTLFPIVYSELRRIANRFMQRERADHTLQPTALVHEAYLRLVGAPAPNWHDRKHFYAVAAVAMRNLLVDYARARQRIKRSGMHEPGLPAPSDVVWSQELLLVNEALDGLSQIDPRQAHIVELRYFCGLSTEEVSAVLGISERTIRREWQSAKAWLRCAIENRA